MKNILELPKSADARARGRAHGEHFRAQIHEIASIRTELAVSQGRLGSEEKVIEAARAHLAVLESFDVPLALELAGIAEGADLDPARLVVLNHYTDLKDLGPEALQKVDVDLNPELRKKMRRFRVGHEELASIVDGGKGADSLLDGKRKDDDEEDCSAIVANTAKGAALGQTWDMHGSAAPYVMMMRVPELDGRPECWVLSITGCLGMTGMNAAGLGVCINNLRSKDAQIGLVWPALVRRMLAESSVDAAKAVLLGAPMASGHHYLIASANGAVGIETSGLRKEVVFEADFAKETASFIHTNHCVGTDVAEVSYVPETSTSHRRYDALTASVGDSAITDASDLWSRLADNVSIEPSATDPHALATCGGIVMDLTARTVGAASGPIRAASPKPFAFT